jgi:cytochrome b561
VPKDKVVANFLLSLHQTLNVLLAFAVLVHVGAAAKHHWIDRDGIMSRMLPR